MAKNETVWGIDVGATSLKALRCRKGSEPGTLEVLQFDFIEHSKIMTQPGADANEILSESLELFLSRNNVKGEKIAISVSGQNALWRFQPLPPIDPKKVGDLIKYEVKQWLPFDLQDVIWDYRQVGGTMEGGVALDLHIFMYAMKREIAKRTLERYSAAGIDVDCIQGAQVALYNAFVHDMYDYDALLERDLNELNDFDVILNVGTDTAEVVVTNGVVVWLRNIAVGGNLFTKALTKSLKLTFSNAEHIKRNAAAAQDPKAVILAMKPVFTDMLTEIDRSIKYYCSLNKKAKIRRIYALGNAMKLPGLRQFLAKSCGLDVVVPASFAKLRGAETLGNAQFKDNASSFAVAYGLALQLLNEAPLNINLIPRDVVTTRLINQKKPWALAAASLLALGLTAQYFSATNAFSVVQNPAIDSAYQEAQSVSGKSKDLLAKATTAATAFKTVDSIGNNLTSGVEGRLTWMELLKAINAAIPADPPNKEVLSEGVSPMKIDAIKKQNRVYVNNIEVQDVEDLSEWFELARRWYYIDDVEAKAFATDALGAPIPAPAKPAGTADSAENAAGASGTASGAASNETAEYVPEFTLEEMFPFVEASETKGGAGNSSSGGSSSSSKSSSGSSSSKSSSGSSSSKSSSSTKSSSSSSSKSGSSSSSSSGGATVAALDEIVEGRDVRLDEIPGPTGPGRIVQLTGYHYHNPDSADETARGLEYLRQTLLYNLKHGSVSLPISLQRQRDGETGDEIVGFKDLGIYYPILVNPGVIDDNFRLLDPQAAAEARAKLLAKMIKQQPGKSGGLGRQGGGMGMGGMAGEGGRGGMGGATGGGMGGGMTAGMSSRGGGMGGASGMENQIANSLSSDKILNLSRFDFIVQFVWMETPPTVRDERKAAKAAEEAAAKEGEKSSSADGDDEKSTDLNATPAADATSADDSAAPATPAADATPADDSAAPATPTADATPADDSAAPATPTADATPADDSAAPATPTADAPAP